MSGGGIVINREQGIDRVTIYIGNLCGESERSY